MHDKKAGTMNEPDSTAATPARRRAGQDRRRQPTSPFSMASLRGSRKSVRRLEDRHVHYYVDLYSRADGLLFTCILLLSVADAFFTLELIGRGLSEYNVVMDYYLRQSPLSFFLIKYALTAFGLLCLLLHKNYPLFRGRFSVRAILIGVAIMYCLLIAYELVLLTVTT